MKKLFYIVVLFMFSACNPETMPLKIYPKNVTSGPLDQKPTFSGPEAQIASIGYDHGCTSGIASYGNFLYKSQYKFIRDKELSSNGTYSRTWSDSYNYCRHWMAGHLGHGAFAAENVDAPQRVGADGIFNQHDLRARANPPSPLRVIPQSGAIDFFGYKGDNVDREFFNPPSDSLLESQNKGGVFDKTTPNFLSHSSDAWPW